MTQNTVRSSSSKKSAQQDSPAFSFIPERFQNYLFVALIALAVLMFFGSAISGGGFPSSDNVASNSFRPYLNDAKETGNFPLWLPYIFSGLPSYAALLTTGDRWWDMIIEVVFGISRAFGSLFGSDVARICFWYILYGTGMYMLIHSKKHERAIAFFGAFAAVFSTFIITWVAIGHNTKPVALSMFPFVLMFLEKIRERLSLLHVVLLIVAMHIMIESTHVQMVFYGACTFGLYLLFELVSRAISKQEPMGVVRAGAALVLAGGLAFAMGSDRFLSTMEYTPYSTRGSAPISQIQGTAKAAAQKQDVNGGNDYEYATNWSFSPEEVATFFVPNYYGFGKLQYEDANGKKQKERNMFYFGQMPFTDAANYMGIGVLFLAIIGMWHYRRDVFVQFLVVLSVFSLFLSFGKNLSFLYDIFFYHVPSFNKFRAPSMALAMMQFAMPILAAYGVSAFVSSRNTKEGSTLSYVLGGMAGLFLLLGVFNSATGESDYITMAQEMIKAKPEFKGMAQEQVGVIAEFLWRSMSSDWLTTAFIGLLVAVLALVYARGIINRTVFVGGVILLTAFDLIRVDVRPLEVAPKNSSMEKAVFASNDAIEFLKNDKSTFRIADIQGFQSPNIAAYHRLENIHGYHSAKMRVYQDLLDEAGNGQGSLILNPLLWNVMNVKYIVANRGIGQQIFPGAQPAFVSQQVDMVVYQNPTQLGRAFFVNNAVVADKMQILKHLKEMDFSPKDTAWVEEKLPTTIEPATEGASVTLTEKQNEKLAFDVTATGNNLLHVSEVYYPVSWKATIDGKEVPTYKTNFAFRSVIVPSGKHKVEFVFSSPKFELGKTISLLANIVTIVALLVAVYLEFRNRKQQTNA